jgi:hypothetical protein
VPDTNVCPPLLKIPTRRRSLARAGDSQLWECPAGHLLLSPLVHGHAALIPLDGLVRSGLRSSAHHRSARAALLHSGLATDPSDASDWADRMAFSRCASLASIMCLTIVCLGEVRGRWRPPQLAVAETLVLSRLRPTPRLMPTGPQSGPGGPSALPHVRAIHPSTLGSLGECARPLEVAKGHCLPILTGAGHTVTLIARTCMATQLL